MTSYIGITSTFYSDNENLLCSLWVDWNSYQIRFFVAELLYNVSSVCEAFNFQLWSGLVFLEKRLKNECTRVLFYICNCISVLYNCRGHLRQYCFLFFHWLDREPRKSGHPPPLPLLMTSVGFFLFSSSKYVNVFLSRIYTNI